ncbi:serine/threonine protein kinase AMPK (beta) regulatory subunit Amk2 [Schizosaccharomyces osmophilus]|uniref:Serine/threonine protein kinase AMPK (Beta) regulatory subunit Amk2 n=1 Tax=Schizosaccharomyces osmophilus TaxID=2545709 RepID=A0AAE9WFQ9_9SCHI|nr:serine/threonine protein kinase AMPK (beta) regulatory subunit Amk2 [Schizosaccharomyces osmophilus]WBW75085.1 serine/threonine protein kinase AMPK (beta) regulatory subunit Amk2 [Schizosaccharomyces osmophilus]
MGNAQSQEGDSAMSRNAQSVNKPATPEKPESVPHRTQSMISIAPDDLNQDADLMDDNSSTAGATDGAQSATAAAGRNKRRSHSSTKREPYNGPYVPAVLRWRGGGEIIYVTGSFSKWKKKIQLLKTEDYTLVLQLRPGTQRFKFLVDGIWCCSSDFPTATDAEGNLYNYLEVEANEGAETGLDQRLSQVQTNFPPSEEPDSEKYVSEIPSFLSSNSLTEMKLPKPPSLPPHLEKCILNSNTAYKEDQSVLPNPNHVVLNHLAAANTQVGVLALSATTRYHRKYVTTAMFKNFDV